MDELHRLDDLLRQGDLDLLEPGRAEVLAQANDAAFARSRSLGYLADRHVHDFARILRDEIGDALPDGAEGGPERLDAGQYGGDLAAGFIGHCVARSWHGHDAGISDLASLDDLR